MTNYLKDFISDKVSCKSNVLNIVHLNAQSLNDFSHYEEFCHIFCDSGIDIIAVSETFFKPGSNKSLNGYSVINNDRIGKGGGGVAVYIKKGIQYKVLSLSEGQYNSKPEYIILEVKLPQATFLFVCIYRPPKIGYLDIFLEDLYNFIPLYQYLIICGDMNARFGSGSDETSNIVSLLNTCNVECLPFGNTFHTSYCDSALDIIASNCNEIVLDYDKTFATGFSCHDLLFASFNLETPKTKPRTISYRKYKNINQENFENDVSQVNWSEVFCINNINGKVECFNKLLLQVFDKHAPMKSFKLKGNDCPWMNGEVLDLMNRRDAAKKLSAKTKLPEHVASFRKLRNKCKQEIRNAKLRYSYQLFNNKHTSKEIWQSLKKLGIGKQKADQTCTISPDILNKHYASVSSVVNEQRISDCILKYENENVMIDRESLDFQYVFPDDVISAVSNITSTAQGVDGISIIMLKMCLLHIIPVLCHIFDFSLQHGVFPDMWKRAQITPVPKITDPTLPNDFRPVSILCVLAKVFEKIVFNQTTTYLNAHNLINNCQSGFRKGHNTTTALIKVADDIREAIDKRELSLLILFDFSKAFDKVHHDLLLTKLKNFGFSSLTIHWFKSYLCGRQQRVVIDNDKVSEWSQTLTGVPQGSVLGPLLYLLYVNDLPSVFEYGTTDLYADDLQYRISFKPGLECTAISNAESDIMRLVTYSVNHNLSLNIEKTQPIFIGSSKYINGMNSCVPKITINNISIPYCDTVRNLGVIFDPALNWSEHVEYVCKKVLSILCQLRRNSLHLPLNIKTLIVNSVVLPHLDYGSTIMEDMLVTSQIKLQRLQNACVRFIFNLRKSDHVSQFYENLGWMRLEKRRRLGQGLLLYKIIQSKTPIYLFNKFKFVSQVHSRSTRFSNEHLVVPQHRTVKFSKSFIVTASKLWNTLQMYSLLSYSYHGFKVRLKSLLSNNSIA